MYLGDLRRHLSWLADGVSAAGAAFVGYFLAAAIWNRSIVETVGALLHLSLADWLFILLALNGPPALLGLLAGRLARQKETILGPWTAVTAAFEVSLGTSLAFGWWLSHVL